jgi:hypothetical protein
MFAMFPSLAVATAMMVTQVAAGPTWSVLAVEQILDEETTEVIKTTEKLDPIKFSVEADCWKAADALNIALVDEAAATAKVPTVVFAYCVKN